MSARIEIDRSRRLDEGAPGGHNRWHPEHPAGARGRPRRGGDLRAARLARRHDHARVAATRTCSAIPSLAHPLTGPLEVRGAEPGDVLEIDVLGYETDDFGWTAIWPGSGFLGDLFDRPFLARWELDGERARSEDVPGVAVPAGVFAGVIGVAPSPELFTRALAREADLAARGGGVRAAEPRAGGAALRGRRPAHLPAARERRQHRHPRPGGRQPAAAAGARARRAALDRRPPLRAGRRRGLHLRHRDRRLRHRAGGPAPRRLAPALPGLGEPAASRAQLLRHHRHPARRRRQERAARPQPGDAPGAARDARLARARARHGARARLRPHERGGGAPRLGARGQAERARVGGAAARRVRGQLDFKCT